MTTECNAESFLFQPLGHREVVGRFDGGTISSDAGALLLRETERITGIVRQFASCFTDHRDPERIEHTVGELIAQRVYALCLGYEDLNDHDQLRHDPLLAVLVGKQDPTGADRPRPRDQGKALAGKSTLNRLELIPARASKGVRRTKTMGVRRLRKCKACGRKFTPKYQPEVSMTSGPDQERSSAIELQTLVKPVQLDNSAPKQDQAGIPVGHKPEQGDAEHRPSENGPSA